jgi:hypothetical protein
MHRMCNGAMDARRNYEDLRLSSSFYQHMFPSMMTTLGKLMISSGEEPKYVLRNELIDRGKKQLSHRSINKLGNFIQSSIR